MVCEIDEFPNKGANLESFSYSHRNKHPERTKKIHTLIYWNEGKKVANGPFVFYVDVYMKTFYRSEFKTLFHGFLWMYIMRYFMWKVETLYLIKHFYYKTETKYLCIDNFLTFFILYILWLFKLLDEKQKWKHLC